MFAHEGGEGQDEGDPIQEAGPSQQRTPMYKSKFGMRERTPG